MTHKSEHDRPGAKNNWSSCALTQRYIILMLNWQDFTFDLMIRFAFNDGTMGLFGHKIKIVAQ